MSASKAKNTSPLVAMPMRTPPTSLLCGMSRDWTFMTSGKPVLATAASSPLFSVTSTSSGTAIPASRSSDLLSNSESAADLRCAERSRGDAPATTGGANSNRARSTIRRSATPACVKPDSTTAPEARLPNGEGSV